MFPVALSEVLDCKPNVYQGDSETRDDVSEKEVSEPHHAKGRLEYLPNRLEELESRSSVEATTAGLDAGDEEDKDKQERHPVLPFILLDDLAFSVMLPLSKEEELSAESDGPDEQHDARQPPELILLDLEIVI